MENSVSLVSNNVEAISLVFTFFYLFLIHNYRLYSNATISTLFILIDEVISSDGIGYIVNLYKNLKMGRTDRLSKLVMFYSLDAEQKELI
jgi:hypothetical protein